MRIDIMTDIETLGNKSDSTIIQIAAIAFDIKTGEHISKFNQIANIAKNETPVKVTIDTIQWWLKPNKKDLFVELLNSGGEYSSEQVLRNFHWWIVNRASDNKDIYLWGKGILFDNKMIQHQLESLGLKYPIFFRNDRDVRTLMELACIKLGITEMELLERFNDESLVLHNAFDDVIRQINISVSCFNELVKNNE